MRSLISFHLFSFLRCVEKTTDGLEMDVPSHYCDPENRPVLKRDCVLHCPGECVISEWAEWSACHSVRIFFFQITHSDKIIKNVQSEGNIQVDKRLARRIEHSW